MSDADRTDSTTDVDDLTEAIDDLHRAFGELLGRIERIGRAGAMNVTLEERLRSDVARIDDTICGPVDEPARIKVATDERIAGLERRPGR